MLSCAVCMACSEGDCFSRKFACVKTKPVGRAQVCVEAPGLDAQIMRRPVSTSSNCSGQNLLASRQPRTCGENAAAFCLDAQIIVRGAEVEVETV